jgi:phosphoribosylamine--glycine ligase
LNILVIDQDRVGLDFCLRCAANGHSVKWFRWSNHPVRDGEGFPDIEIVDRWQDHAKWAKDGLIIPTVNNKYLFELDDWRRFGYPVMGPSVRSAALEVNRGEGMKAFEQHGLNIPEYKTFNTLQDAKKYVLKTDANYAFKPMGDEENKAITFVSSTPAQMAEWIEGKIKTGMVLKGPCMLQTKIDFIAEVGIAGWMGPDGFLPDKWELAFEHKKLCSGNFGCSTGETGTVCQYVSDDPLVSILESFADDLRGRGHLGDVNINGGVDEKGDFWPFEFTMRLGWPDFFIRTSMHKGDIAEQFRAMLDGKDTMKVSRDPHIGAVCAQRPYPYGDGSDDEVVGKPIYGLDEVWNDVHPCHVMMSKGYTMTGEAITVGNVFRTTGCYVLVATGSGSTVSDARKDVYGTIGEIKCSDLIVRDDIGECLEAELPKLHKLGYAKSIEY